MQCIKHHCESNLLGNFNMDEQTKKRKHIV